MGLFCILNPVAGRGRAEKAWFQAEPILRLTFPGLELHRTGSPGQATDLARMAVSRGFNVVLVIGGDGTLHEAVNGLAVGRTALAVIPAGTGNDFARTLGIPEKVEEAAALVANGRKVKIDLGSLDGEYFINMAGLGYDAAVAHLVNQKRLIKGKSAYLWAILRTLISFKSVTIDLEIDGCRRRERVIMTAVGNGQYVGGGVRMLPLAVFDDGEFDICIVRETTKLDILKTLPGIYQGKHLHHPKCIFLRGREVKISLVEAEQEVYVQLDGQEHAEVPLTFRVVPHALEVIVPNI